MIDDPLALIVQAVFVLAAGMYPVGFLFGTCSACCEQCTNTSCNGFDLEEVYSKRYGGTQLCDVSIESGATTFTSSNGNFHAGCKITGNNIAPNTFITLKTPGPPWTYTFSPPAIGAVSGCINVCGRSGLCDTSRRPSDELCLHGTGVSGVGECESNPPPVIPGCNSWVRRRSCIRWVCRCYESTGERALENPNVSEWYEVVSTTVVGGPTTNDLDLGNALQTEQCNGTSIEEYWLSATGLGDFLGGPQGTIGCVVWAFTFFGWTTDCETTYTGIPTQHVSKDDCYQVSPCTRCD